MKLDEQRFWKLVKEGNGTPRDIVESIGMNEKRALYLCQKWADQGIYDYGVSPLYGWVVEGVDL